MESWEITDMRMWPAVDYELVNTSPLTIWRQIVDASRRQEDAVNWLESIATTTQPSIPSGSVNESWKGKAGMVHSVSGWTQGVQVKLWNPLRTRAIPECLRGVITTMRYTNPRLPYLTLQHLWNEIILFIYWFIICQCRRHSNDNTNTAVQK